MSPSLKRFLTQYVVAVLSIAGGGFLVFGVLIPGCAERRETMLKRDACETVTRVQIQSFVAALKSFETHCGRFPSSAEGLGALIARPPDVPVERWHGPFLDADEIPKDPWGHDYVYHCPGQHGTNRFEVYSRGPDGISKTGGGDSDDLTSWPRPGVHQ
jgi:general secretion pathway protein G